MRSIYKHYNAGQPVKIVQNDDEDFSLFFFELKRDEDGELEYEDGRVIREAVDITGWTIYLTIKRDPENDTDAQAIVAEDTGVIAEGEDGRARIEYSCDTAGRFYGDIMVKQDGKRRTVRQFVIEVSPESTRAEA